jgi:hypothetical protein
MSEVEPRNCWEFWNCKDEIRNNCIAYKTSSGAECWMLVGSIARKELHCPKLENRFKDCSECSWFKKMRPDFNKK